MAVLALDIGGTNVRTALFAAPSSCVSQTSIRSNILGFPFSINKLITHLRSQINSFNYPISEITAIGISVAAVVDHRTGHIKVGENVGWQDVPLGSILSEEFDVPVRIDSDTFCGAIAESRLGNGAAHDSFLYVAIGTGIGHGLILNRQLWRGLHSAANVFGHLKVLSDSEPCYCGGEGCLCQFSSGKGIARLGKSFMTGGAPDIRGGDVVASFQKGEAWARAVLEEATFHLAFSLSQAYNLLDIECVVLGGGAISEFFPNLDLLRSQTEDLVYPEIRPVIIRKGKFIRDAVLIGAALLAFNTA